MSGVHGNHGHHRAQGHHRSHGDHGKRSERGSGEHRAHGKQRAEGSAPAAQAQQPSMDDAMKALDQAIKGLAANFHKDSFNGQQAPADVAPAASTLTNSVGNRNNDMFLQNMGASAPAAQAPVAQAPVAQAPATTNQNLRLGDPLLDLKGGGGASGGVLGDRSYLTGVGGGGASGGVLGDRSAL